jgi:hypothetical protein
MVCYDCRLEGKRTEAVGICHHCSAALCWDHAHRLDESITMSYPVAATVELPLHARLILCGTCQSALGQTRRPDRTVVSSETEGGRHARPE